MARHPWDGDLGSLLADVPEGLPGDPVLLGAVLITVLLVAGALVWLWLRRRTPGARFRRVLAKPERITVLMHSNPDPDAMATALGVAHLADEVGTEVAIQYPGQIRHQENRAFRTVLDLDFDRISSADELASETVVLVDHHRPREFHGCDTIAPYAIIDHHPGDAVNAPFADVRPEYGACASIIAEYYTELGFTARNPEDYSKNGSGNLIPATVATGLLYGILADTNHLTRGCTQAEFNAGAFLYPGVDQELLDRIANPEVDAEVLDVLARAIIERDVRGPFAVTDVGKVSNVDAIPQAADELLQLEGVTAVVVLGETGDTLHLSGRSRDDRVHMGDVLAAAVEDIAMSNAGGHARMGGGQVSVPHLEGLRPESGRTKAEFIDSLFDHMRGDT